MSIKITYSNLELKNGNSETDMRRVKEGMARDASWGTHVKDLIAAKNTCGADAAKQWRTIQPEIWNHQTGYDTDTEFSLNFPKENFNFEKESVDHFVGTVAGDIVLNSEIKSIEVKDFEITDEDIYNHFPGPNLGIAGVYGLLDLSLGARPLLAFTVKPRLGLVIDDYVKLFKDAAKAGVDIIEDDERLVDPLSCPFDERIARITELQKNDPGLARTIYSPNITGDSISTLEKLGKCIAHGIKMVKIDVLVSGFETLRKVAAEISAKQANIAITVYPDAYLAYRKLSREFILKLSRLCGADIIYSGSFSWSRFASQEGKLSSTISPVYQRHKFLSQPFTHSKKPIRESLPTISNDENPSTAELLTAYFKHKKNHTDYAFFVGGGISGFPGEIRTAIEIWKNCIEHAAKDTNGYSNFAYGPAYLNEYGTEFKETKWQLIDVKRVLQD